MTHYWAIFLQDFLEILKRPLQNLKNLEEILKKCFLDTTYYLLKYLSHIIMLSVSERVKSKSIVSVAKGLIT